MEEDHIYRTLSGTTQFVPTPENTSCTGGTVTDIYVPEVDEYDGSLSYILTLKELRSCSGFEEISREEAESIIITLSQLSSLSYHVLVNE